MTSEVDNLIEAIKGRRDLGANVVANIKIPSHGEKREPLPDNLHANLSARLKDMGLATVYSHQAEAISAAIRGENVIIATPTSSGKTLCYTAPVISRLIEDKNATALFLYPLKALARDQYKSFTELADCAPEKIVAEIFDGDTKPHVRKKILSSQPRAIFTNPDMLHLSILPAHGKWEEFFKNLSFVIIDEAHTYRGVFGSHTAAVIRRLKRISARYGANPKFVATSATINNPGPFAEKLTGEKFTVIKDSGAPRPGGQFLFYNTEGSPYTDASKLLRLSMAEGMKTIAFTKARKITELVYLWTIQAEPELEGRLSAYRAGFLPEERRKIESDLFGGKIDAVISTSALEMGVDIGGLDVCILIGYPGAVINTWQRAGRVGRGDREFLIILIAQPDALDQHFMKNPKDLFARGFEDATLDPENKTVLKGHIVCAAAEEPLADDDLYFTPNKRTELMAELQEEKKIVQPIESSKWLSTRQRPGRFVNLRSIGDSYSLFGADGKSVIGTISGSKVFAEAHEGAVYLHMGRQYRVTKLDFDKKSATVEPLDERYYTRARTEKETDILEVIDEKTVNGFQVFLGKLKVKSQVIGYEKRSIVGQESLGVFDLDMPVTEFNTVGFWVVIDDGTKQSIENSGEGFMGGIHAFEHGAISLFPLFALCDRDDIGGISYPHYPGLGKSAVFFYDGYPDGVGLCEEGFMRVEELWNATFDTIAECECEAGCPSCIHSPKCGSGNKPLDKHAAIHILEYLSGRQKVANREKNVATGADIIVKPLHKKKENKKTVEERNVTEPDYYNPSPESRVVIFDLETQKSAADVGGWGNIHLMELAVAVVYDSVEKKYIRYWESDADALIEKLLSADLVVGFNQVRFDYGVLKLYTKKDLPRLVKSFDIMLDVWDKLGHRLSLNHLAQATLKKSKTADGLQSLVWWANGERDKVADYCEADVRVTKELFEYGLTNQRMVYKHRSGDAVEIKLDWELDRIIKDAAKKVTPKKRQIRL